MLAPNPFPQQRGRARGFGTWWVASGACGRSRIQCTKRIAKKSESHKKEELFGLLIRVLHYSANAETGFVRRCVSLFLLLCLMVALLEEAKGAYFSVPKCVF